MTPSFAKSTLAAAAITMLSACSTAYSQDVETASTTAPTQAVAASAAPSGPALWKVADEDTTIYLFGTVHALPEDVNWLSGPISEAIAGSDTLVTEISSDAMSDPTVQQTMMGKAMYTDGSTLREVLTDEQRATYEAALTQLGLPVQSFDPFEPWFAGMTLAVMPLMQNGYTAESGVEKVIEGEIGPEKQRDALETVEFQLSLFDALPQESQVAFLMTTAQGVDSIVAMMDAMVDEWIEGDADGLAELMNQSLTDPVLAEALLYSRNRNWAAWIQNRLAEPGTVFIAVGAGHLAGEKSVQDYLEDREIEVTRLQ